MAMGPSLRSPPIRIEWDGFVGESWVMERCGWEFAMNERRSISSPFGDYQVLFRNPRTGVSGMGSVNLDLIYMRRFEPSAREPLVLENVNIRCNQDRFVQMVTRSAAEPYGAHRIDMQPEWTDHPIKSPFDIFKPWAPKAEQIIVEPATVSSLLEQIKRMQASDLADIRQRNRTRDWRGSSQERVCAQIITMEA